MSIAPPHEKLKIKVVPGASRSHVAGWLGDALKVRVAAPPEKGKANKAVESVVAQVLGLPSDAVRIVSGQTSPHKVLEIDGLTLQEIKQRIDS